MPSSSALSSVARTMRRRSPPACSSVTREAGRRKARAARVGPFDEDHRVVEVGLEVAPLRRRDAREAVEVEMGDRDPSRVAVPDREGRARHGLVTPSARQAPRTNVVLPEPSSPETVTTSPGRRLGGERAGDRSVSPAEALASSSRTLEQAELNRFRIGVEHRSKRLVDRSASSTVRSSSAGDPREVLLEHLQHRRRVERGGRVVDRVEEHRPRRRASPPARTRARA